eukprot:3937168-Rhodomonas_salina.1
MESCNRDLVFARMLARVRVGDEGCGEKERDKRKDIRDSIDAGKPLFEVVSGARTQTHTDAHRRKQKQRHRYEDTQTHTNAHRQTHRHTETDTETRRHIERRSHTHTHPPASSPSLHRRQHQRARAHHTRFQLTGDTMLAGSGKGLAGEDGGAGEDASAASDSLMSAASSAAAPITGPAPTTPDRAAPIGGQEGLDGCYLMAGDIIRLKNKADGRYVAFEYDTSAYETCSISEARDPGKMVRPGPSASA